jgi:polyphenol oxidase
MFLLTAALAAGGLATAPRTGRPAGVHAGRGGAAAARGETRAPAFDFTGVTMPTRRSFSDYTADDVTLLKTAYGALKNLPDNDPRAWMSQANLHAAHCGGDLLEVHSGWWFTAWHRGFLFFYERILATLSGTPAGFALPYWDWEGHPAVPNTRAEEQQGRPSPFFDRQSPLFDPNRFPGPATTFASDPNTSNAAYYCGPDYVQGQLLPETDFTAFCGGDPDAGGSAGDLEQNPHNHVHIWTGLNDPEHRGRDMDDLATAARDLLFFLHHANVDRLFTLWLARKNPLPPADSPWYAQWFNFTDEKGNPVSVTVRDALDRMAGNYQPPRQQFALVRQPQELTLGGPARTLPDLAVPKDLQARLGAPAAAPARRAGSVRLVFEGVEAPHDVPVVLHVFLDRPDATAKDVNGPGYAGTLTLLPSSRAHGKGRRPVNLSLEVGAKFGELLRTRRSVSVTVVPADPGFAGAAPAKVRFQGLSVVAGG